MSERDTHFQGFAKLRWIEISDLIKAGAPSDYTEKVITQHIYDLAYHVLYCDGIDAEYHEQKNGSALYHQEVMKRLARVPDPTTWTE